MARKKVAPRDPQMDDIRTVAGKREFLVNFINSVRDELIVKAINMPEEWDSFELRWLVADKFNWEKPSTMGRRTRRRDYKNEALVRRIW